MQITESKMFNENEKKEIMNLFEESMALSCGDLITRISRDKNTEAKFIDDSVKFWKKSFKPKLQEIVKKINDNWNNK